MKSIMIITDGLNDINYKQVEEVLREVGYQVLPNATVPTQTIIVPNTFTIDLILLDIHHENTMIQYIKKVREQNKNAKILCINPIIDKKMAKEFIKLGASHVLQSPYKEKVLLNIIYEMLYKK